MTPLIYAGLSPLSRFGFLNRAKDPIINIVCEVAELVDAGKQRRVGCNRSRDTLCTGSNPVLFTTVISLLFSVRVQNGDENKE